MATLPKVLIKRTPTPNLPPAGLQPGELSVEMADPLRLWIGVPPALHPDGRKEITSFVHVGDAPPVNPPDNKLWWESDTGIMWIYYNDGTSKQWVAAVSGSGSVVTGDFLPLMGGTLTGDLKIENLTDNSRLILNPKEMVDSGVIIGQRNSLTRWVVYLGMGNETGGNVGGDFGIQSYSDIGGSLTFPFKIERSTGKVSIPAAPTLPEHAANKAYVDATAATGAGSFVPLNGSAPMTGPLSTPAVSALAVSGTDAGYIFKMNGSTLWYIRGADPAQSNLDFLRYTPTGVFLGIAMSINRNTGEVNVSNSITTGSLNATGITSTNGTITGTLTAQNIYSLGTANLTNITGNNITINGQTTVQDLHANGWTYIGTNGFIIIHDPPPNDNLVFRNVSTGANVTFTAPGKIASTGIYIRNGSGNVGWGPNVYNFHWVSPSLNGYLDETNLGAVTFSSDYRMKKDIADLESMWDKVKTLRPVKYTHKDFTPPTEEESRARRRLSNPIGLETVPDQPMFVADDKERWGFVAHELQEALIMDAASAYKDAPDAIQSPNPWTVIATLTKALQEAMTRIEALEAQVAGG